MVADETIFFAEMILILIIGIFGVWILNKIIYRSNDRTGPKLREVPWDFFRILLYFVVAYVIVLYVIVFAHTAEQKIGALLIYATVTCTIVFWQARSWRIRAKNPDNYLPEKRVRFTKQ